MVFAASLCHCGLGIPWHPSTVGTLLPNIEPAAQLVENCWEWLPGLLRASWEPTHGEKKKKKRKKPQTGPETAQRDWGGGERERREERERLTPGTVCTAPPPALPWWSPALPSQHSVVSVKYCWEWPPGPPALLGNLPRIQQIQNQIY